MRSPFHCESFCATNYYHTFPENKIYTLEGFLPSGEKEGREFNTHKVSIITQFDESDDRYYQIGTQLSRLSGAHLKMTSRFQKSDFSSRADEWSVLLRTWQSPLGGFEGSLYRGDRVGHNVDRRGCRLRLVSATLFCDGDNHQTEITALCTGVGEAGHGNESRKTPDILGAAKGALIVVAGGGSTPACETNAQSFLIISLHAQRSRARARANRNRIC